VHVFRDLAGTQGEIFGWNAAALGDVNGDGVADLVAAAPFYSVGFSSSRGKLHAFSGADGAPLWTWEETVTSAVLGYSLEVVDWNGDGLLDVLAGAPFAQNGKVWVLSGLDGVPITILTGPPGSISFGATIAVGGDVNGNGIDDVLIASPNTQLAAGRDAGQVFVFQVGTILPIPQLVLDGAVGAGELGLGLAFLGDISVPPDGRDEFVVGHRMGRSTSTGAFWDGQAHVVSHDGFGFVERYVVEDIGMGYSLGTNLFDAGRDLDLDGFPDFVASDSYHGEVEVVSGRTGARLRTVTGFGDAGDFQPHACLVDDLDGDGGADLVIGSKLCDEGATWGGKLYLCSGASGSVLTTITSTNTRQRLGTDVRPLGDWNGDGRLDLVVGAPGGGQFDPPEGHVYVVSAHLPAPANVAVPAELAADPALADVGGDPATGPLLASVLEPFALALDCRGSSPGNYALHAHLGLRSTPFATPHGFLWLAGQRVFSALGAHASQIVDTGPTVLPSSAALIGLVFTAQGLCGGTPTRTSNALVQTIGR
jgi:hypothetical protein